MPALATTALAALVAAVLAAAGEHSLVSWNAPVYWHFANANITGGLLALLARPAFWATVAGWLAAAACLSLLSRFRTLPARIARVALAVACVLTGTLVFGVPTPDLFISVILAAATLLIM